MNINNINIDIKRNLVIQAVSIALGLCLLALFVNRNWIEFIVALGVIIFISLFILFRKRPEILITIAIILNYVPKGTRVGYTLLICVFVYLLIQRIINRKKLFTHDTPTTAWLIVIILGLFTIHKWSYPIVGLQWFAALAVVPMILHIMIVGEYLSKEATKWLTKNGIPVIFGFIVLETLWALFSILSKQESYFSVFNIMTFHGLEITGNGSNRLAGLLVFISLFGFLSRKLWKGSWLKNMLIYSSIFVSIVTPLIMMSRSAFVSFVIALLVYIVCNYIYDNKINIIPIIMMIIVLLIIAKPFVEHLIFRIQNVIYDASTITRIVLWKNCVQQIKTGLLIGSGPGQYIFHDITQILDDPHNMFLRYGVDFGGVSIILLLLIICYPLIYANKMYKQHKDRIMVNLLIYAPPLLGTVVHSQIDSTFTSRSSGPLLWLIWALFVKALKGYQEEKVNTTKDIESK